MKAPFSMELLDKLMDQAGIDVLVATSKENVQYMLGGYRFVLFAHKDSIGISHYQPCVGYVKGKPESAFFVGCPIERPHQQLDPGFWITNVSNSAWQSVTSGTESGKMIAKLGLQNATIGVERSFIPVDTMSAMQTELPNARFVEVHGVLDELRAVKRPDELATLKEASELIIESLLTVMTTTKPGTTTRDIFERVRREEVNRGLNFEYCLPATGASFVRVPSDARWEKGTILSLDSGGNKDGYIGDLCRMAVMGEPTSLMKDLLAEVQAVQTAARSVVKPGVTGKEIFASAQAGLERCAHHKQMVFLAHGMGLIQHEAPQLTSTGAVHYDGVYAERPLRPGMVLSIETDLKNPEVGFVKLEDTVVITENGLEAFGDRGRDWNICPC